VTERVLTGLDGSNPLAFMAALGTLRVISQSSGAAVRLSWREEGRWRPVLHLPPGTADPVDAVMMDLRSWKHAPELSLQYEKDGKSGKKVRDLKPRPEVFKKFLQKALKEAAGQRRFADFAAAYGTDMARDGKGNTKPTAFHFTAGQQNFLEMVDQLAEGVKREHVEEALSGPWRYESELPVLRWDVSGERLYALLASDPAGEKAQGVPGADWLAFQALPLFPCFPEATLGGTARVLTTAFEGHGKDFVFRWPLWTVPATLSTVRSLLAGATHELSAEERRARGIAIVLESQCRRSDHGYGTFSAPVPAA
jgi:hypothetical protein